MYHVGLHSIPGRLLASDHAPLGFKMGIEKLALVCSRSISTLVPSVNFNSCDEFKFNGRHYHAGTVWHDETRIQRLGGRSS